MHHFAPLPCANAAPAAPTSLNDAAVTTSAIEQGLSAPTGLNVVNYAIAHDGTSDS